MLADSVSGKIYICILFLAFFAQRADQAAVEVRTMIKRNLLFPRVSLSVLYKLCCQSIMLAEGMVNRVLTFSVNSNVKYSDHTIGKELSM